jgi:hypothetical protein
MILTARAGSSDLGNLTTNVPNGEGAIRALRWKMRSKIVIYFAAQ